MSPETSLFPGGATEEVAALIETLLETGQRLEALTAGEVDTVSGRDGRTFLLRHAQEQLRAIEATKQAAILNALPANIALLDAQGLILCVNEAWRKFGRTNAAHAPGHDVGVNYLAVCDRARGADAAEASQAAAGIRLVLSGAAKTFSLEYPCHSPTEQRWFQMTVTPLMDDRAVGVVVMHLDITGRKQSEEKLRTSGAEFRTLAESMPQIVWITRPDGWGTYINQQWMDYTGLTLEESLGHGWNKPFHPDEQQRSWDAWQKATATSSIYSIEGRLRRADGVYRWWLIRGVPLKDATGNIIKWFGTCTDIHDLKMSQAKLAANEVLLRQFIQHAPAAIAMLDRQMRYIEASERWMQDYHLTGRDIIGKSHYEIFPEITQRWKDIHQRVLAGAVERCDEDAFRRADGSTEWLQWEAIPWHQPDGEIGGIILFTQVITERKLAEDRVLYLNRVYALLSGINTLIVHGHDRDEIFREACRIAVEKGGFRMALIGMVDQGAMHIVPAASAGAGEELLATIKSVWSSDEFASTTMAAGVIRDKTAAVSGNVQSDPKVLFSKKYTEHGIRSIAIMPLIIENKAVGVLALYASEIDFFHAEELKLLSELANDIAFSIDHIKKQDRLEYLAYYDPLTGLANQSLFLERLQQKLLPARNGQRKIAVFVLDIERFRSVNEAFGQQAGDALLKQIAERLVQKGGDASRFARLGVDRFAIVASDIENAKQVGRYTEQRLEAVFHEPFQVGDNDLRVSAKVGIALFPDDGADAETLLRNAEAALKKSKATGEPYLFFTQAMTARVAERLSMENKLRQAIEKDEFALYYQPKVNLVSGKVTSVEALIRWNDPKTGLVPPVQFIPLLEETGLIHAVGRWALHKAIADYLRWRRAGLAAVRVAVNVSPLQLRDHNFVAEVTQAIGVDAQAAAGLELEITESLIMEDVKHSIESLKTIRALGITIAIDDFGTGFSSLSYLAKLPVDTLKIDRSFILDMTTGPEGLALMSTIINLAHSLKLKVVAEGVDSEEQSRLLRLLSCDEIQGYLFSKPVPSDIFEAKFLRPSSGV